MIVLSLPAQWQCGSGGVCTGVELAKALIAAEQIRCGFADHMHQ